MTKDEALKLALEALVTAEAGLADIGDADREPTDDLAWCEERAAQALAKPRQAITALREVLAQELFGNSEQLEPVAYINVEKRSLEWASPTRWLTPTVAKMERVALYTSPPQRQPLTEEKQIAEDLRFHGLQLVKTATGYAVLKLGQVVAHGIGDKT